MSDWSAGGPPRSRRPQGGGRYDYYRGGQQPPRGRDGPPPPPPPGRGGQPPRSGEPPRPPRRPAKKKSWGKRLGIALLVVVALLAGLVIYFDSTLQRTAALDFQGQAPDSAGTNWLLVGSDSREGLDEAKREELAAGDAGGRRTDTMMLVHVPSGGGQPALISLPRDSYVSIPGHGKTKLNAAFSYGGPQLLSQTVEQATGVHIDHYAEIGFGGFADLVDAVGGVEVTLEKPMNDDKANVHLPAGPNELDGPTALGFVRARYSLDGGDFERTQNQRKLLGALVDKATSPATLLNPFRLIPLANGAGKTFLVNENDHVWNLFWLAMAMGDISKGQGVTTSVPFAGFGEDSNGGSVIVWDKQRASQMFQAIAEDEPIPPELLDQ
ncbi:LCP family protein [Saccharopolyspora halophila]|uniref:LCP family protein n=1 Tax=Saccharopolyspora halophila TaxID=405551 RepID=A0ABN3GIG5_9PSEU